MAQSPIDRIRDIFRECDAQTRGVQLATGLQCLEGCGACCHTSTVEANVAEMLPTAWRLFQQGEAEFWYEKALASPHGECVFYAAHPENPQRGRCQNYATRPTLCRIFGFGSVTHKEGNQEFVGCRPMTLNQPKAMTLTREAVHSGRLAVPNFAEVHQRVVDAAQQEGGLGPQETLPLPINSALMGAIERVSFQFRYKEPRAVSQPQQPSDLV